MPRSASHRRFLRLVACGVPLVVALACPALAHEDLVARILALDVRIANDPADATLHLDRGELHRIHRDRDAALADYDHALALDPGLVLVDLCVGRMDLETGRPAEAIEALNRYATNRPGDARALVFRGRARMALDDPLLAAADFALAIALHGEQDVPPELYLSHARALQAAGGVHLAEALHGLEQGLERLGRPVTLELMALDLERATGRFESALARLDRLATTAHRPEPWLVRKGEVLEQAGRPAAARRAYEAAGEALEALPEPIRRRGGAVRLALQINAALDRLPGDG